jgi:hypothetical protein
MRITKEKVEKLKDSGEHLLGIGGVCRLGHLSFLQNICSTLYHSPTAAGYAGVKRLGSG